jgi:signal transduction histidine kinase/ActR/RegA family two-component response regulator
MSATTQRHSEVDHLPVPGGETGAAVRSVDWSCTPLGPVSVWPSSLDLVARVVRGSGFPLMLWWGPQLVEIHNDACRAILGEPHAGALGRPAAEVWTELWSRLRPQVHALMEGRPASGLSDVRLAVPRRGFTEDVYVSFSFSAVPDDQGQVGGILIALQDTSERVRDARQREMLRELEARTAPARTEQDACRAAADVLGDHGRDVPFACIYLLERAGAGPGRARLAASCGLTDAHRDLRVEVIDLAQERVGEGWPLREALRRGTTITLDGVPQRFANAVPSEGRALPERAVIVPLAAAGQARPHGFLVAGVSLHRALDAHYASLLRLVAAQIGAALSAARALEEERQRAAAQAELERAKAAFIGQVSHAFRTPLTLMLGPTRDALVSPARALRGADLEAVYRNGVQLLGLVNALLDFSRLDGGPPRPPDEVTDLCALTRDVANAFRTATGRAGLRLDIQCPPHELGARIDRSTWEKILFDLLSNALKFTFEGTITVKLSRRGGFAELTVRDTGTGIAPEQMPRLFERFHRIPGRARSHDGSGIGLAHVQELVKQHGGTVHAYSEPGVGSMFTVRVPAVVADATASTSAAPNKRSTAFDETVAVIEEAWDVPLEDVESAHGTDGARVLLVDDNADMRAYLKRILGERWQVETAVDGEAALRRVRQRRPDLIVTDVTMPHLDGFGLLRAIREEAATADLPVIMISARAGDDCRAEGIARGADDFLVKPFASRELVARVGMHLQISGLRRAVERERSLLTHVFEQAPVAVAVWRGPEFVFELANTRYRSVFSRADPIGKTLREVFPEADQAPVPWREFAEVYATGRTFVAHDHPVPREEPDDGARSITTQVESRRAIERAATTEQQLRAQAEAANRTKDDFLALLGHELRNPLAPMLSALEVMRLRGEASRELDVLGRQVAHLTRLVDDLLDVSRIARGAIELRCVDLELHDVVMAAIEVAAPLIERRGHRVHVQVPERGVGVHVDPERMTQVVANLLTNAAKYSDEAKVIEVRADVGDGRVCLHVKDQGTGIAPDMLARVFDAFVQQPQTLARSLGGLGIGLTIVRSLVELHAGRVTVASDGLGRGSEFVLDLPHVPDVVPSTCEVAPERFVLPRARRPTRVLVVDDNEDAAEMLQALLTRIGYVTLVAHDGDAALARAQAFDPDIAILDIGLPGMDGYELASRLHGLRVGRRPIRMLAVTGYGQPSDRSRSAQVGFEHHLVKPVELVALERVLGQLS